MVISPRAAPHPPTPLQATVRPSELARQAPPPTPQVAIPSEGLAWALVVASSGFLSSRTRMNRGKRREMPFSLSTWGGGVVMGPHRPPPVSPCS